MNDIGRCPICKEIFTNPVLHAPCQQTFDRECLKDVCPTITCKKVIRDNDLIQNPICKQMAELLHHPSQQTIYHLILLDTSTSMRYSDSWLPFLFGESRFTLAVKFVEELLRSKQTESEEYFALVTFDVDPRLEFYFETIVEEHFEILQSIKPNGKKTALFDALNYAEEMATDLRKQCNNDSLPVHLIVLTDGGINFGSRLANSSLTRHHNQLAKQLHINGFILQIGDQNLNESKRLSEDLNFRFRYFRGGNINEFARQFINELSRVSKTPRIDQMTINLPEVPDHVVGSLPAPAHAELCT